MLNIALNRNKWTVTVEGHAGYAAQGSDIVCAGASMLTATLARCLGGITGQHYVDDGERTEISCTPTLAEAERVAAVFDVIDTGYQLLANSYPVHVKYTRRA
jgi:uncharacterized protein YsxB (DUF464 family)